MGSVHASQVTWHCTWHKGIAVETSWRDGRGYIEALCLLL